MTTEGWRKEERRTHIHTPTLTVNFAYTNTHTYQGTPFFQDISWEGEPSITYTHNSCLPKIGLTMIDPYTHTHTHAWLPAQTHIHLVARSFFSLTGASPLHECSVTLDLRTYFTSVEWVFLVETIVLQSVLWDIRAWSARFLVCALFMWKNSGILSLEYF